MEPCEKLSALLDAFIDGELPEAEANQVRRHLAECENCRAYVADAFAMRDALEDLADVQVPEGFSQTVMDAVRSAPPQARSKRRPLRLVRILAPLAACLAIAAVVGLGPLSSRMTEDAAQAASQESCQTEDTVQPQERDVSTEPQTASNDNAANAGAAQYFASTSDSAGSGQTETTQEDTVQAPASLPSTLQTAPEESTPQQEEDTARKETTLIQDVPASITTARVDEENSDGETGASSPQENTVECFAQLTLTPDQAGTLLDGMDASEVVRDPDTGAELQRIYYLDQQQFQDLTAQLEDVSWTDSGSGEWAKVVVVMQ